MVKDQLTKIVFSRVLLLGVLCVTLSLCLASCSDDDAPATKPVDEEIVEKGIFSYAKNCTVKQAELGPPPQMRIATGLLYLMNQVKERQPLSLYSTITSLM